MNTIKATDMMRSMGIEVIEVDLNENVCPVDPQDALNCEGCQ